MDRSRSHLIAYICTCAVTSVLTILLTFSFLFSFDSGIGYFSSSNAIPTVMRVFAIASFVGVTAFGGSFCKIEDHSIEAVPLPLKAICISAGIISAVCAGALLLTDGIGAGNVLACAGMLCFGGYIALIGFDGYKYSAAKFIMLSASVLLYDGTAYKNYTDFSRPINSSENIIYSCISVIMLIFILTELKVLIGKSSGFHFTSMLLGFSANLSCSVSYLIAYACGKATSKGFLSLMLLSLAISVYLQTAIVRSIPKSSPKENILTEDAPTEDGSPVSENEITFSENEGDDTKRSTDS